MDLLHKCTGYVAFGGFFALCLRLVFALVSQSPGHIAFLLILFIITVAWFSGQKTIWLILALVICIPLISGFQRIGYYRQLPILDFIFAVIFITWLPKRVLLRKQTLAFSSSVNWLLDSFALLVIISLFIVYIPFPIDLLHYRLLQIPVLYQALPLYGVEVAQIWLQGIFLCRILILELDMNTWPKSLTASYLQTIVIIPFALFQVFLNIPKLNFAKVGSVGLFSPFNDIHSFGSYIVLLFFMFFIPACECSKRAKWLNVAFSAICISLIILSWSRTTWLVTMVCGFFYFVISLSNRNKVFIIVGTLSAIVVINLYPSLFIQSNSHYLKRFCGMFYLKTWPLDNRVKYRFVMAERAVRIIQDNPLSGNGIGSFYRTSADYREPDEPQFIKKNENSHNYYLQIASELGIPALILFFCIILYMYSCGFSTISITLFFAPQVKGLLYGISAYLLTMLSSHPLIFSSQQLMFWFVVSIIFCSFNIVKKPVKAEGRVVSPKIIIIMIMVVGIFGNIFKMNNLEAPNQYGYYLPGTKGNNAMYWTMQKTLHKVRVDGNILSFSVYVPPQIIPVQLTVKIDGQLLDKVKFTKPGKRTFSYHLPNEVGDDLEFETYTDRTFTPFKVGMRADLRNFGIRISDTIFLGEKPSTRSGSK